MHAEAAAVQQVSASGFRRFASHLLVQPARGRRIQPRPGSQHLCALALDREKRQVDALTSNIGHLLWSGIVREERARQLIDQLLGDSLFSGWGIRTLSSSSPAYNPLGYHLGTVWPHDTALAAEGMRRYGRREEAARIAAALVEAAAAFAHRLPECFAGFPRDGANAPIEYARASRPQAFAAAAPLLLLRTLLGLDVNERELRVQPYPSPLGRLSLRGLTARGKRLDVETEAA